MLRAPAVSALLVLALAAPAAASERQIAGSVEDEGTLVTGSLEGSLSTEIEAFVLNERTGVLRATGTEVFDGCLAGTSTCGTIRFTFRVSGRFLADGSLRARCLHVIAGGSGDFADAEGLVTMRERHHSTTYRGHLDL